MPQTPRFYDPDYLASTVQESDNFISPNKAKNYIINGNFNFWQRGISFSQGQKYTADRFWQDTNNLTTLSQQSGTPPIGSTYYARCACTTGPALVALYQALEADDIRPFLNKTIVFSVLLRRNATHSAGNFRLVIQTSATANAVNTGFSTLAETTVSASSVTTGTGVSDWTRITVSVLIPAGTNGVRFGVSPDTNNATGAYWESAQWQVNEGSVVAPFQTAGESIAEELAICQRYCFVPANNSSALDGAWFVPLQALTTTFALGIVPLPVSFRATPSLFYGALASYEVINGTSIFTPSAIIVSPDSSSNMCVIRVDIGSSGYAVNNYYHLRYAVGSPGGAAFILSSEL